MSKRIPVLTKNQGSLIPKPNEKITKIEDSIYVDFRFFKAKSISINGTFNNHFRNGDDASRDLYNFLGEVLPKVCSESFISLSNNESKALHFHKIDVKHQDIVKKIMKSYEYSDNYIAQVLGDNLFEFKASFDAHSPARVVAYKSDNILFPLFLDSNHHIYMNESKMGDSLFYEYCPDYIARRCNYMPDKCYAFDYLDYKKLSESFNNSY